MDCPHVEEEKIGFLDFSNAKINFVAFFLSCHKIHSFYNSPCGKKFGIDRQDKELPRWQPDTLQVGPPTILNIAIQNYD